MDAATVTRDAVESNIVRCPDPAMADQMIALIDGARKDGDSLGGVVEAVARGVPAGLGEPVFDKLEADLAKAMLSLPACKGFESGSGFGGTRLRGSQHNDPFYNQAGRIRTRTNRSGGIQGGISNGEDIVIRAAFKPTATILREQQTVDARRQRDHVEAAGKARPVCAAAGGADGRGDDRAGAGRSLPAAAGARRAHALTVGPHPYPLPLRGRGRTIRSVSGSVPD